MSSTQRFDGPSLEAVLATVQATHGESARILNAHRVRAGGLGGFFAKERFEVDVEVEPGANFPEADADDADPPAADGPRPPASILDLADEVSAQESGGSPSASPPASSTAFAKLLAARLAAEHARSTMEAAGLAGDASGATAGGTRVGARSAGPARSHPAAPARPGPAPGMIGAGDPVEAIDADEVFTPFDPMARSGGPASAPEASADVTTDPTDTAAGPLVQGEATALAPAIALAPPTALAPPGTPTGGLVGGSDGPTEAKAPIPARALSAFAATAAPTEAPPALAAPAPSPATFGAFAPSSDAPEPNGLSPAPIPAVPPGLARLPELAPPARTDAVAIALLRRGLPTALVPVTAALSQADVRASVIAALDRLPVVPTLPSGRASVVAVVGTRDEAYDLAVRLGAEHGVEADHVLLASHGYRGRRIPSWQRLATVEEAESERRSWCRRTRPTVVAVEAPVDGDQADWASRMLAALEPNLTWGIVHAGRKTDDLAWWIGRLGGVDALAVTGVVHTLTPADVLSLGVPVGLLDGEAATADGWADLLLAGVAA